MTLSEATRAALTSWHRFTAAEAVQRGRVMDPKADYRGANIEYVHARNELGERMQELKAAAAGDGVRVAAEAGSPMARMLEPNGRG